MVVVGSGNKPIEEIWIEKGTGGINQRATTHEEENEAEQEKKRKRKRGRRVGDASRPL